MNQDSKPAQAKSPSLNGSDGPHFMPKIQFSSSEEMFEENLSLLPQTQPAPKRKPLEFPATIQKDVDRALEFQKKGRPEDADAIYQQVLKQFPNHPDALHLSGLIRYLKKDHDGAQALIRKAIQSGGDDPVYLNSLGSVLRDAGKLEEASQVLSKLMILDGGHLLGLINLAQVYRQQGKISEAILLLKKGMSLDDSNAELLEEYAFDLCQIQDYRLAAEIYAKLLKINPAHLNGLHLCGCCLFHLKQYEKAIELFQKVLDRLPNFGACYSNKGACHQALAEFAEARACYEKALALDDQIPDAHNNLANVLQVYSEVDAAEKHYKRAIELDGSYTEPLYSLGEIQLLKGDFDNGWQGYAKRVLKREHDHRFFDHPPWEGQPLTNEGLLVYAEQGIGDVVMFASCLKDVMAICPKTILETDPRMVTMFERSFPGLQVIPRSKTDPYGVKVKVPGADRACGMGDLPVIFSPDISLHPGTAYLRPDPSLVSTWKKRFQTLGRGLKVGISWRGGKNKEVGVKRSLPLEQWKPILQTSNVQFINLQYGDCAAEKELLKREFGVTLHDFPESNPLENLELFAAQMTACDLVISIDNATVHFAGALGVPCWALLNKTPEWRWLLEGHRSYWYKSLRLFRQTRPFQWDDVADEVARVLRSTTSHPESLQPFNHRLSLDTSTSIPEETQANVSTDADQTPTTPCITLTSSPRTKPHLAIITPVGPGHAEIYGDNLASIKRACQEHPGAFEKVKPLRLNDTNGTAGRSYGRNFGIHQAVEAGCEWIFFLDADDVLVPNAFEAVAPYLDKYDAIWGQIYSFQHGTDHAEARPDQLGKTDRYEDILNTDPFYTLQMGHFVRTEIALKTLFHEDLDAGEDFHYYLRLWEQYRCIKIDQPFFANRRGMHSTGPRSANGQQWMKIVGNLMQQARDRYVARQKHQTIPEWQITKRERPTPPQPQQQVASSQTAPTAAAPIVLSRTVPKMGVDLASQTNSPSVKDHTKFWESDNFQNIIPQNPSLGEFPEGWNAREVLSSLLTPYADLAHAKGKGDGTILEIGCGYGRLSGAFSPEQYHGVDININAIQKAQSIHPLHRFTKVNFLDDFPSVSLAYTYCVLLHIDDEAIRLITRKMCQAAEYVVIGEILGRKWRRDGLPPVYNREQSEYEGLMAAQGYRLFRSCHLPYLHYQNTNISFLIFRPNE